MAQGDLYINGYDAHTTWGVTIDTTGLSALMTPPGQKDLVTNSSRLEHGKRVINNNPKMSDRDITLGINLCAYTEAQFLTRYSSFCQQLATGALTIKTRYQPGVVYKTNYISCTQFSEFSRGIAKFSLKLNEPDPSDRTE